MTVATDGSELYESEKTQLLQEKYSDGLQLVTQKSLKRT